MTRPNDIQRNAGSPARRQQCLRWFVVIALGAITLAGCKSQSSSASGPARSATVVRLTAEEVHTAGLNFADAYVSDSTQAYEVLIASTKRPEVASWAKRQRIATALAAYTNASGPHPVVNTADLIILASLKRAAIERHWIPLLLHEEGAGVLETARHNEDEAWALAERAFTPQQVADLHTVVETWIAQHPDQYYIGWVRLGELAASREKNGSNPFRLPNNLLGLFYIDPLAGIDPVTQELRSYRALSERLLFIVMRMPTVWSWQIDETVAAATMTPETRTFVSATTRFADATEHFAKTTSGFPELLRTERHNFVEQLGGEVTTQRQELLKSLDGHEQRLNGLLVETQKTIASAESSVKGINTATADTIRLTERSGTNLVAQIRDAAIVVILVVVAGIMVGIAAYRLIPVRRAGK